MVVKRGRPSGVSTQTDDIKDELTASNSQDMVLQTQ